MTDSTHTPDSDRRVVLLEPAFIRLLERLVSYPPDHAEVSWLASEVLAGLQPELYDWSTCITCGVGSRDHDDAACSLTRTLAGVRRRGSVDL